MTNHGAAACSSALRIPALRNRIATAHRRLLAMLAIVVVPLLAVAQDPATDALDDLRAKVDVLLTRDDLTPEQATGLEEVRTGLDVQSPEDVDLRSVSVLMTVAGGRQESKDDAMWQAIEQAVNTRDHDCAHFFGGVQVYEYRHAVGTLPALITPYESYSLYLRRELETRSGSAPVLSLRHMLARHFESWMFAPFDRRVVVAERDRRELRSINPALDWEVIPNGVDADWFQPGPEARESATLLFTGNFEYEPNVDAALWLAAELLPGLRKRGLEAQLWLVGHAPPRALRALAGDRVLVTGRVPDLRPWLQRATLYVCPLRKGAGIKNKVLEALAAGCPLLATPLSADGIAIEDGRHALLAERDAFPAAVRRLLDDAALRDSLALAGRQLVESQYSWRQVATRYAGLYQTLASGRTSP